MATYERVGDAMPSVPRKGEPVQSGGKSGTYQRVGDAIPVDKAPKGGPWDSKTGTIQRVGDALPPKQANLAEGSVTPMSPLYLKTKVFPYSKKAERK